MSAQAKVVELQTAVEPSHPERVNVIQVPVLHLRALLHLAAKSDVRYYLNGVHVEATTAQTRVSATQGAALGILRSFAENEVASGVALIIPRRIIELLRFAAKDEVLELRGAGRRWSIGNYDIRIQFSPVDGTWPDVRKVLPTEAPSGVAAQFDPELVDKFRKTQVALGALRLRHWSIHSPVIHHNGSSAAALVTLPGQPDFAGLIMPLRYEAEDSRNAFDGAGLARDAIIDRAVTREATK